MFYIERHRSREKDRGKREKVKFYTAHPDLLLSFVYFDHMHTGYLIDKDAEEILHTIGLHLSRAQVSHMLLLGTSHALSSVTHY